MALMASQVAMTAGEGDDMVVNSRFGKITINQANAVMFPNGLVGMPEKTRFCITQFPSEKMERFKLLQCADDHDLCFVTLPVDINNEFVERADIEEACHSLGINPSDLAILLIVSVHRRVNAVKLSVNSVAPLLIDSRRKVATQYVFANGKYQVRHMIS